MRTEKFVLAFIDVLNEFGFQYDGEALFKALIKTWSNRELDSFMTFLQKHRDRVNQKTWVEEILEIVTHERINR